MQDEVVAKAQRNADRETFNNVLTKCEDFYKELTGNEPDQTSDIWAYFITKIYDASLRLHITQSNNND
jgi:hypothetical protein